MGNRRLISADLTRIYAAFVVAVFHLAFWSWAASSTPQSIVKGLATYPELAAFTSFGHTGPDIFFVLSGFVIAYTAAEATALDFAMRRFLRLVPGAIICATISFVVMASIAWEPMPELIARYRNSVTLAPNGPYIDGVYWTLPVEIGFYMLIAVILLVGLRKHIEAIVCALGLLASIAWLGLAAYHGKFVNPLSGIWLPGYLNAFSVHVSTFAIGVVTYCAMRFGWTVLRAVLVVIFIAATFFNYCCRQGTDINGRNLGLAGGNNFFYCFDDV